MQPVVEAILGKLKPGGDARRLFHGRGHTVAGCEGINVDWFDPVLLITLYEPLPCDELDRLRDRLSTVVPGIGCCLVQRRYQVGAPTELLWGSWPENPLALEAGLRYRLRFTQQNIGFFLDMAPGRAWLRARAAGKRVLNLFAFSCAFSVVAVDAGARSVLNVDMSRAALSVGRDNHRLNGQALPLKQTVSFLGYDILRSWRRIIAKGPFDIVIIDPPSYQKGSFVAANDYAKLIKQLVALLPEGGEVLLCLNAPTLDERFLQNLMSEHCASAQLQGRLSASADFPELDNHRSLKLLHYHVPATLTATADNARSV